MQEIIFNLLIEHYMKVVSSDTSVSKSSLTFEVARNVWGMRILFVNVFFIRTDNDWVLVDAGVGESSAAQIRAAAIQLFGENNPPRAIVLTHGHFDHVGAIHELLDEWGKVPVYAHYLEVPYLTGLSAYPPPDPSVGGGMMAWMAWTYPRGPIHLDEVQLFTNDGIPELPDWDSIHTPGHTAGHISLFRPEDGVLIVGDAFVTTKQESAISVLLQSEVLTGPPKYYTTDWEAAKDSVRRLADLKPTVVATGHGRPMRGAAMRTALQNLADNFEEMAVPAHGRYVNHPAVTDASGVISVPPIKGDVALRLVGMAAVGLLGSWLAMRVVRR